MEQNDFQNKNKKKEISIFNHSDNSLKKNTNEVKKTFSCINKKLLEITKEDIRTSNKLSVKNYKTDSDTFCNINTFNNELNNIQNDISSDLNNSQNNVNYIYSNNEIIENSLEIDDQEQTGVEINNKYANDCSSSDISD